MINRLELEHCVNMCGPHMSSSTSLRHTPESITVWILSLGPSDRYESAQQASARTSGSVLKSNLDSTLKQGDTCEKQQTAWLSMWSLYAKSTKRSSLLLQVIITKIRWQITKKYFRNVVYPEQVSLTFAKSGGGFFPLHKLDSAHTAFRVVVSLFDFPSNLKKKMKVV